MKWMGKRAFLPLAAAAVALGGCGKAKDALKEALGAEQLTSDDIAEIKTQVGWNDEDPRYKDKFAIHGGFKVNDKFPVDLGAAEAEVSAPFIPDQASHAEGKNRSIALMKVVEFELAGTQYSRLQIMTVASFDSSTKMLKISSGEVNAFLDDDQKLSKENQGACDGGCDYLVVEGLNSALAYLKGTVSLKKDGETATEAVGDALLFTDSSPFVTKSGNSTGSYILAMLEGSKGTVFAYKKGIGSVATGTPESTSTPIPYIGVLDEYKDDVDAVTAKAGDSEFAGDAKTKADELFNKANTMVSDWINGWKLVDAPLLFVQPHQEPAVPPPADKAPSEPKPQDPPPADAPDTDGTPDDGVVPETGVVRSLDETDPQVDLGCQGFYSTGTGDDATYESSIVYDRTKYADDTVKGWRTTGTAYISNEYFTDIFGSPSQTADEAEGRYLDDEVEYPSYCYLSTGNGLAAALEDDSYLPGPDGAGQVSEMWQKVKVPSAASGIKSIQVRVAFFSQEYPRFVGTKFNDSFFIKFDESLDYIASGNLNDLAAGKDPAEQEAALAACSAQTMGASLDDCGDWTPIVPHENGGGFSGQFGLIGLSEQAQNKGVDWLAMLANQVSDGNERAYYGMVKPRVICKNLAEGEFGQDMTLRFHVEDVGDNLFDSGIAIDTVMFSTSACGDASSTITNEEPSRVNEL